MNMLNIALPREGENEWIYIGFTLFYTVLRGREHISTHMNVVVNEYAQWIPILVLQCSTQFNEGENIFLHLMNVLCNEYAQWIPIFVLHLQFTRRKPMDPNIGFTLFYTILRGREHISTHMNVLVNEIC